MNPEEALFYKIETYLLGQLPPPEAAAFEAEMAADPALAAEVWRQYKERQALEVLVERQLRADMNAWERAAPPELVPVATGGRGWVRVPGVLRWAAAVLVLAVAGWWIFQRQNPAETLDPAVVQTPPASGSPKPTPGNNPPTRQPETKTPSESTREPATVGTPERQTAAPSPGKPAAVPQPPDYAALADEFYRERDFFPAPSATPPSATSYDRALRNFQDGRYTDVLPQLRPGQASASNGLNVKELTAHAQYKNRQYDAAAATFQEIINSRRQPYADRAEWALALTYLRQMPRRQALLNRTLDRILAKPNHAFYAKAKALRERL